MKKMVKNNGITLIALVITVIILLILAGITISQLTGSAIFEKAKEARDKWKNTQNEEEIQIAEYSNEIDNYVDGDRAMKNAEKMMKPNTWPVGTEQDFGDGVYGIRFTGNFTSKNSTENLAAITGSSMSTAKIKNWGGDIYDKQHNYHLPATGGISYTQNGYNETCFGAITIYPNDGTNPYFQYYHYWNSNNADYDIWVLYTK